MEGMKFKLKITHEWGYIDGEFKKVDATETYTYDSWDDVQNVLGYLVEGRGHLTVRIETVAKEAQ